MVYNALSSTYSITKFANMALTGEPIGQPNICLQECAIEDEVTVSKHKRQQFHDVGNGQNGSFRDGWIKTRVLKTSHLHLDAVLHYC